jgi:hypothetical protein
VDPEPFQIGTVRVGETDDERWAFWMATAGWCENSYSKAFFHDVEKEFQRTIGEILDLPVDGTYDKNVLRLTGRASALEFMSEFPNRARRVAERYRVPEATQTLGDTQARKE